MIIILLWITRKKLLVLKNKAECPKRNIGYSAKINFSLILVVGVENSLIVVAFIEFKI